MVASDGHRLSLIEKEVDFPSLPDWPSVILPKKGLVETRKLLERSEETIEMSIKMRSLVATIKLASGASTS